MSLSLAINARPACCQISRKPDMLLCLCGCVISGKCRAKTPQQLTLSSEDGDQKALKGFGEDHTLISGRDISHYSLPYT